MDEQNVVMPECETNGNTPSPTTEGGNPNGGEVINGHVINAPEGGRYWIPICDPIVKPRMGQRFKNLLEAMKFYEGYAKKVGFVVRNSTLRKSKRGEVLWKYMLCNREGYKQTDDQTCQVEVTPTGEPSDESGKKRRVSRRVGCGAKVVLKPHLKGGFFIHRFDEAHTHPMVTDADRPFMKINRKMHFGHQSFVTNCARANIGPVKCYRLYKELVGGYENIGASSYDFRNFKRDLRAYIHGVDAQLVIDKLFKKQEICQAFSFDYDVDENDQLTRLFWADPIARKNFSLFGDVVAFDATYRTNRYNLVFVPFTAVDNHKRCVTLGAGLLMKEDVASYTWLLNVFKKSMGHEPKCTVTDQDPAMKIAIAHVFPNTRHRFCMWHIMMKVGEKVGAELAKDEVFRSELNRIVWCETSEPQEFEEAWHALMVKYKLTDNTWLNQMFEIRKLWVPAYFHDLFLAGLVRTTSRCEGENSFFGSITNPQSTLVEFLMHYESAIDAQRHTQAQLNADCDGYRLVYKTELQIERHIASIYTIAIFYDVQTEIRAACFDLTMGVTKEDSDGTEYRITDKDKRWFTVRYIPGAKTATCTCKKFERVGLLCKHIFMVLKNHNVHHVPEQYVVARWTMNACMKPIFYIEGIEVDVGAQVQSMKSVVNEVWAEMFECVGIADGNSARLQELRRGLKELKE